MAVVLSEDQRQVLLLRREVFVLWDLPGGAIEKGESPAEAAVRECREETGYEIQLDRMIGQYLHPSVYGMGDQLTYAFRAHIVGGASRRSSLETTGMRWFALNEFPRGLQPLQHRMILDALVDTHEIVERRIDFPRWKLCAARVVFFFLRWRNVMLYFSWKKSRKAMGKQPRNHIDVDGRK